MLTYVLIAHYTNNRPSYGEPVEVTVIIYAGNDVQQVVDTVKNYMLPDRGYIAQEVWENALITSDHVVRDNR